MELIFSGPVQGHHYTLKCLPESNLRQHITALETKLLPAGLHWESRDAFGNRELLGVLQESHEAFSVELTGEARLLSGEMSSAGAAGHSLLLPEAGITLYPEEAVRPEKYGIFRYATALTCPGKHITDWLADFDAAMTGREMPAAAGETAASAVSKPAAEVLRQAELAAALLHALHRRFRYQKAATDVSTTAEEAMERGAGVCQDYAHIFLSLLRLKGIPARYVTGMLRGEGESHAWVEAALGGFWYGLDPTNDCAVSDQHVRIACGRDFSDCRISQGVFYGGASQCQRVEVKVYTSEEKTS